MDNGSLIKTAGHFPCFKLPNTNSRLSHYWRNHDKIMWVRLWIFSDNYYVAFKFIGWNEDKNQFQIKL